LFVNCFSQIRACDDSSNELAGRPGRCRSRATGCWVPDRVDADFSARLELYGGKATKANVILAWKSDRVNKTNGHSSLRLQSGAFALLMLNLKSDTELWSRCPQSGRESNGTVLTCEGLRNNDNDNDDDNDKARVYLFVLQIPRSGD
ncbi:hypothetical protein STEG23_027797, partial [Scotinomys teguina]